MQLDVFVSKDGKIFLTEEECSFYEREQKDIIDNVRYYAVASRPDLTETGLYSQVDFYAVYTDPMAYKLSHLNILYEYLIKTSEQTNKKVLSCGVQGYGLMDKFKIVSIGREDFDRKITDGKPLSLTAYPSSMRRIFLSTKELSGFPDYIDYNKLFKVK